jgi:hypothetical protein
LYPKPDYDTEAGFGDKSERALVKELKQMENKEKLQRVAKELLISRLELLKQSQIEYLYDSELQYRQMQYIYDLNF